MATIKQRQVAGLTDALDAKANASVTIFGNNGITGGGNLGQSRTLGLTGNALALHNLAEDGILVKTGSGSLAARSFEVANTSRLTITNASGVAGNPVLDLAVSGVSAGTYTKVTTDIYGRITSASNPTTLSGYGITDGISSSGGTMAGALLFSNSLGSAIPTLNSRSAGSRLVLRQTVSDSLVDTAIGYQAGNMWFSVQDGITANQFNFYGGTAKIASLDGQGNLEISGAFTASVKHFKIPHPTRKGWKLQYGSLEGPENGVYFRGRLVGKSIIDVPSYWKNLVDENSITVHITGRNRYSYYTSIKGLKINILLKESSDVENIDCDFVIFAERKDVSRLVTESK